MKTKSDKADICGRVQTWGHSKSQDYTPVPNIVDDETTHRLGTLQRSRNLPVYLEQAKICFVLTGKCLKCVA